jgi:curli production assembly/transport component CsgF
MGKCFIMGALLALGAVGAASASELVYQPINPSFGGNPFNSSHLLGIANAVNKHDGPQAKSAASSLSQEDLFAQQLQSRLLSGLTDQVVQAVFGPNAQDSGKIVFGDQTITFSRGLEAIHLSIFDSGTGKTTTVDVPTIQVQ